MAKQTRASTRFSLPVGLALTAVGIPFIFYLRFGFVDGYAIAFAGFLLLLQLAIHFVPKKSDELGSTELPKVSRGRFDFLGVVWLLSIPFAPFLGWIFTNAFDLTASNWKMLFGICAALCVVVPIVCVLPLIRYVRQPAASFMIAVLAIGTAFPVLCGLGWAIDFVRGPSWEHVNVVSIDGFVFQNGSAQADVPDVVVSVHLADGRTLMRSQAAPKVHSGSMQLLVLDASKIILDAR
jgi:hypothetical protein